MQTFLFDDEVEALTEFEAGGALSDDRLRTLERFATTEFGQQMLSERAPLYQDSEPTIPSSKPQLKFEVVEEEPSKPAPAPAAPPAEQPRRAPTRNPNSRQRPEDMPQDQFQLSIYGPRGMRGSAWLEPFDGLPIDATQQEIKQSLLDRYNDINVVLTEDEMATFDDLMRDDTEAASRFFDGAARIVPGLWDLYMGGMKESYAGALRRYGMGAFGDPREQVKQDLATAGETGRKVVIQTRQLWNFFSQMFGDVMAANRGSEIVRQELAAAGQLTGNNRADMPIIQQEIQRRREAGDPVFGADQDQQDFQQRYQNYAFNRKLDRAFAGLTSYEQDGVEIMEAPDVVGGTTFSVGGQQPMPSVSTGGAMIFDPVNIAAGYAGAFTKARLLHRFAATSGPAFAGVEKGAAATISFATRKGEQLSDFAQRKTGLTANQLTAISGAGATLGLGLSQVAGVDPETGRPTSSAAASFGRGLFLVTAPLPAMRAAGVILKTTKEAAGAAAAVSAEAKAGALGIRSALSPTDQASAIRAARTASAQELLSTGAVPKQYSRYMSPGGAQQAADSTLKRVAQNTQNPEALRRAARFADQIGVTTAARVGDDLFSGAVVGGAMSVPFAVAAPDPETAGAIVGGGVAFGTAGNLIGGKFARMQEFIDADIARMMVDVNAQGGDAVAMFGMPKDQLIRLAGTQGMLANKGTDLIPLRTEDYVANVPEASDGIYMPPNPQTGQRRQVFVDLGHSSLRDGTVRVSDNGDGWFNVRVEGDGGYAYAFKTSDPAQLAVKDGDKVKAYQPLNKKSPASMIAGEEFIHAVMDSDMFDGEHKVDLRALIDQEYGRDGVLARKRDYAARTVDERIASGTEDNVGFIYADDLEAKQVAEGTKTIAQIRRERGRTTKQRDEMIDETIAELDQASIDRTGDPDAWIKDEILGQTWASLSQSLDLNRLRRGQNPELVTARAAEGVMVITSRALELFGLKTDAGTGRPLSPPSAVFRENPLTISPVLKKRLTEYVRNYDRYLAGLEDAGSAQPRGVPIARSNSPKDLANSPFVKLRRNPRTGLMENDFMFVDATGTPVFKEQADINNTEAQRRKQVATLGGDKILPNSSTEFGPRRLDTGRVEISGPTLPDKFFLFNHFPEHVRDFARQFQTGRTDGMSFLVDYNAIGSRSSGTYRVRNLGNVRAIQREFVPTGFIRSSTDHLLVAGIDMNSVRAAAMKAINKGDLGLFNNDMTTLTKDLVTYLDNHKNGRPGEATIGIAKRDMLNGLIGTGTAVQRKANPLYSDLNRSGSVRTFRLDRVNEAKPTGRTGLHFDYDKLKNNRMPRTGAATLVDDGAPTTAIINPNAPKDAYARSIEDIKAVIPPSQRFVGNKVSGSPVMAPDGRPYLQHDLSKPTGNLFIKQADLDQAWKDAVAETGPAAQRALDEMRARGFNMVPPNEAHWRAVGNLPLMDRFWYETSAEAMVISFPGLAQRGQSPKVMDTVAATSPLADPNYNAKLAISFLSEDFRQSPAQTPAVVPKGVSDALLGTFGREEQRKIGSFGGTFRFLAGLSDDPPLTTNDRQVASSFGVPDKVFGEFPVMYEAVSRFYNKLRDTINAGQADKSMGAFEAHQLQALSWVQHRAELEMARNKNVSAAQAFDGDAYAVAFKRAADELRAEGIAVASDPGTGLPIFDDAVLSNPRVTEILAPTSNDFMRDTFQTMEIVTKLTKTGEEFLGIYEQSKALGLKGNIKDATTVISRHMNALTRRKDLGGGKKAPSLVTDLARVFDEKAEITRIESGYGTFKGDFGQNLRIPLGTVPEQYRPAFLAILGKYYQQEAQAASRFLSSEPGQAPTSYSVFFRGRVDTDFLGGMAQDLSAAGYEANVSVRPNGVVVDVVPQFTEAGLVPIDPALLKNISDTAVGDTTTASVIGRDFSSIYLERPNYANEINKAKKGLLNDTAREIQTIAGASRQDSRAFAEGTGPEKLAGNAIINRRAAKARDRYRQRLSRLESVEARLRDLAKEFQKDMAKANRAMKPKLERRIKAASKPAQPAPAGLDDL
jgi:hypothetical protein